MAGAATTPFPVEGKVALITGAGSGINFCFASLLLSKGCNVLIADLALRPEAQTLPERYSSKSDSKPRAIFQQTDVTQWTQLQRAFTTCLDTFNSIDIVCPGAGVFEPPFSNFWIPPGSAQSTDAPNSNNYTTLDINVTHPIRATQMAIAEFLNPRDTSAVPKASPSNPKRVILTSSIAGQTYGLPTPLYFASKHAIIAFTRSLGALESTLGIRVNAVAPGVVKTPLWTEHEEKLKWVDQEKDVWVTPEEIAAAMLRLLTEDDLVGGTVLEVGSQASRVVPAFMNPGPRGEGMGISHGEKAVEEVFKALGMEGWGKGEGR
ncbi:NAD(P)-binding protein [Tothia fuscella]|uniref:NAD(P)-binding protein n=1 Tax=Tothia fuscella TaxID=1048955 RepID=A0A9P4NT68_9PEZI|nr:NAD(P)-binding protein [Tothia fuscella]